jgi:hypothetical protein
MTDPYPVLDHLAVARRALTGALRATGHADDLCECSVCWPIDRALGQIVEAIDQAPLLVIDDKEECRAR